MFTAYLLVAHGSRDPLFGLAVDRVALACEKLLANGSVGSGYLELAAISLVDQIVTFVKQHNCQILKLLPLFLAPGVHSSTDIPAAVDAAQLILGDRCQIILLDYLGASLPPVLADIRQSLPPIGILLVHGSRQGGDFFTNLAASLDLKPAYWAICPPDRPASTLADIFASVPAGNRAAEFSSQSEIGILQYFLFPGKTSAAIAATVSELKLRFPHIRCTPLLGEHPLVIQAIEQLLRGEPV
jgi:sirohydrochlorin cobaltochelatase